MDENTPGSKTLGRLLLYFFGSQQTKKFYSKGTVHVILFQRDCTCNLPQLIKLYDRFTSVSFQ